MCEERSFEEKLHDIFSCGRLTLRRLSSLLAQLGERGMMAGARDPDKLPFTLPTSVLRFPSLRWKNFDAPVYNFLEQFRLHPHWTSVIPIQYGVLLLCVVGRSKSSRSDCRKIIVPAPRQHFSHSSVWPIPHPSRLCSSAGQDRYLVPQPKAEPATSFLCRRGVVYRGSRGRTQQ